MRYLSVFSGLEAATVAWEPLGFKAVGFSEIEPFTCEVLKQRFPNIPNHGDITKHTQWPIGPGAIDILVGGSPCQAFSVAGLQAGMADPRGNLSLTFLGLADRLKPEWIVWENVPGVLSSNEGRDFGSFLGAMAELGYGFAYRVLDCLHFGVPQRRPRVFLVAKRGGDWRGPAEILALKHGFVGDTGEGFQERQESSGATEEGAEEKRILIYRKSRRAQTTKDHETWLESDYTNTINLFDIGDVRTTHIVVSNGLARRLTPLETERVMGFPDNWSRIPYKGATECECPDRPRYRACGNSMAVPVMRFIGKQLINHNEKATIHSD